MDGITKQGCIEIPGTTTSLAWAAAYKAKTDGTPTGDGYLVHQSDGSIILAAVDGAGSGAEATQAAALCLRSLVKSKPTSLEILFSEAHRACRSSRGAALVVALIRPEHREMSWAAVGDMDGLLLRGAPSASSARESVVQRGGTLGHQLPPIINQSHRLSAGDTIVMTSDGIRPAFREPIRAGPSVETLANDTLHTYGRDNDDALVLVMTYCEAA